MHRDQISQHRLLKRTVDIFGHIFQGFSFRRCVLELLLLCHLFELKKAAEFFICVKIVVENISRFNVHGKTVICHIHPMPNIRKAINSLLLLFSDKLNKKHARSKLSALPPWKNWMWNRSFIKCIFYFLKTVLFFDIFKGFIFKLFLIYECFI